MSTKISPLFVNEIDAFHQQYAAALPVSETHKIGMIAWDLDGTAIINNEASALDTIRDSFNEVLREFKMAQKIACCRDLAGKSFEEIRGILSERVGFNFPHRVEDMIKERRLVSPTPKEDVRVLPAFRALMHFLNERNVPQAIVTGSEHDRAVRYLKRAGLSDLFPEDLVYSGHKPDPKAHRAARKHFGVYNTLTIGIEDSLTGLKALINDRNRHGHAVAIGHLLATHISESRKDAIEQEMFDAGAVAVIRTPEQVVPTIARVISGLPEASRLHHRLGRSAVGGYAYVR